jgi:IS605 OrfB family transposase
MLVQQTIRFRLALDSSHGEALAATVSQYAEAFNAVTQAGWKARRINGVELHHKTYYPLRERLTLPSQLVISARKKAIEALKSARALAKMGRTVSCPKTEDPAIRFDARSYRLDWKTGKVHLTVVGGRIEATVHRDKHSNAFWGLKTASADLIRKKKGWFLHVVIEREVPDAKPTGKTIGVDRGICRPAVTSEGKYFGNRRWRDHEERLLSLKRMLQAKGTRSAKRHLDRIDDRLSRFRRDCDHVLSKDLVESCEPGDTLVFEDLTGIRNRAKARGSTNRRRLHAWSFARLGALVDYKAALKGVLVAKIDPRDTSRRCPQCGHIEARNRISQSRFRCAHCGFSRNSDLVASWNIRDRHKGLWSPVSKEPGRVNGPNAGGLEQPLASPGL